MTLNDFKPSKLTGSSAFMQVSAVVHISRVNCAEITRDRPGQLFMKFLAQNAHFNHFEF